MAQRTRGSAEAEEARALLRASLTFALLESVICVFEAILGGVALGYVANFILRPIYNALAVCIVSADRGAAILAFVKCSIYTLPLLVYLCWRHKPLVSASFFRFRGLALVTTVALFGYCVLHLLASLLHRGDSPAFSLGNFIHTDVFRFTIAFDAVLFTPLKEEVLFRVLIHNFFLARNPNSPVVCVLYTSFVFSAYHLLNSLTGRFSFSYILLQMCFSYFVGVFYGLVFVMRKNVWEPYLLHVVNNLFASLARLDQPLSLMSLDFLLNTVGNFALHVALLFLSLHNFERKWA